MSSLHEYQKLNNSLWSCWVNIIAAYMYVDQASPFRNKMGGCLYSASRSLLRLPHYLVVLYLVCLNFLSSEIYIYLVITHVCSPLLCPALNSAVTHFNAVDSSWMHHYIFFAGVRRGIFQLNPRGFLNSLFSIRSRTIYSTYEGKFILSLYQKNSKSKH